MALGGVWGEDSVIDDWDDLRKQARRLESELDDKLVAYRKVANTPADSGGSEMRMETRIKELLKDLHHVNSQMQKWVSTGGSQFLSHTLARHNDILHELTHEFARINSTAKVNREHAKLLETFGRLDKKRDDEGQAQDSSEQTQLLEAATISRTNGQLDAVIGQVRATLSDLNTQRSVLGDASSS